MMQWRFTIVVALQLASPVSGATYYVSPAGVDSAAGTTEDSAWLTLRVASSRLASGDTLLLQRGGQWLDEWLNVSATH